MGNLIGEWRFKGLERVTSQQEAAEFDAMRALLSDPSGCSQEAWDGGLRARIEFEKGYHLLPAAKVTRMLETAATNSSKAHQREALKQAALALNCKPG